MRISIPKKLTAGFGICVFLMIGVVVCNISSLLKLENLYRDTFRCFTEMELATDAQHIGGELYLVIANAVINRDLAGAEREWTSAKSASRTKLHRVAASAETPQEREKVAEAEQALGDIIRIYETEMLPLIRSGASVPGPLAEIDARVDRQIEAIERAMQGVARMMSEENARASREFHAVLNDSIRVGILLSLLGVLASLGISLFTTRSIVRPLKELTAAAGEMGRGNYAALPQHRSGDEAGVLAHAFRAMAGEVARRTTELEAANGRLNREVADRRRSEEEICRLNAELEQRVAQRTEELVLANERLSSTVQAQHQAETKLRRSRAELRGLTQHLQEVREAERTAMAREVHDDLGQMLTAMKMDLVWIERNLGEGQTQLRDRTAGAAGLVDQTIGTVQRISAQLRPGILDDLGLHAALEWQAEEFQKKTGIEFQVRCRFDCDLLSQRCSTELFRIFQETLTNIYRHSEATRASVTLDEREHALVVTVTDNGRGVSDKALSDNRSLGFIGMRERVSSMGGELAISRNPAGGTSVQVVIPLDADQEEGRP